MRILLEISLCCHDLGAFSIPCLHVLVSFCLGYCYHGDNYANRTLKRNVNVANFTRKEDGERKIDMITWTFPGV